MIKEKINKSSASQNMLLNMKFKNTNIKLKKEITNTISYKKKLLKVYKEINKRNIYEIFGQKYIFNEVEINLLKILYNNFYFK